MVIQCELDYKLRIGRMEGTKIASDYLKACTEPNLLAEKSKCCNRGMDAAVVVVGGTRPVLLPQGGEATAPVVPPGGARAQCVDGAAAESR